MGLSIDLTWWSELAGGPRIEIFTKVAEKMDKVGKNCFPFLVIFEFSPTWSWDPHLFPNFWQNMISSLKGPSHMGKSCYIRGGHWRIQPLAMGGGGILRQRQLHWWIQRTDFGRSGPKPWPNPPQFSTFSLDLGHFIFKLQNFDIFYFDVLFCMSFLVRSPVPSCA